MSRVLRWHGWLAATPVLLAALILTAMLLVNEALQNPAAWSSMPHNWLDVALLALVMTPIIITGGIDLSVGSIVGFSAVVAGYLWRDAQLPVAVALTGGVLAGLLCGSFNGLLVLAGINPLVVTLATLGVFRGLAYGVSGKRLVDDFPPALERLWYHDVLGLPLPLWLYLVAFALGYVALHHTWMGRMLFAIGDNRQAARFAALPVRSLTFSLYALSGLTAGLVGMTTILRSLDAPATRGEGLELDAIACVVLGGVRITGGSGHLAGTLLGTFTLVVLLEGMAGVLGEWRPVCTGSVLILIAIANEALARWRERQAAEATRRPTSNTRSA
jgi:rhamnose transport system permease protein